MDDKSINLHAGFDLCHLKSYILDTQASNLGFDS